MDFTKIMEQIEMNLNIEEERREFEAWYEADALPAESDWFKKDDGGDYFHAATYSAWSAWLAAKRAAVGSAEPVVNCKRCLGEGALYFGNDMERCPDCDGDGFTAPPAPVSAEPAAREAIRLAVQRITEIQKRDGGRAWQEAKAILFSDLTFVVQDLIDALAKLPPDAPVPPETRPCACVGVETGTRCKTGCEDAPLSTNAKDSELIETLVSALKAARAPIASDCESFSTNRNVLAKIDAAIAAKEAGKC